MPANYDVVQDTFVAIRGDHGPISFDLETPGIDVAVRAVLSFMLETMDGIRFEMFVVSPKFKISLGEVSASSGNAHVRQEVIDVGILEPTGNQLRIDVRKGAGKISDIVLWYQVKA